MPLSGAILSKHRGPGYGLGSKPRIQSEKIEKVLDKGNELCYNNQAVAPKGERRRSVP